MRRPLPLWLAVVVPSMIAGHALAYALGGRPMSDEHHAWVGPLLEGSLALTLALATWLLGGVFLRARLFSGQIAERHVLALWPRLALLQLVIFCAIERAEGAPFTLTGCAVQVVVALLGAYIVSLFSDVLDACAHSAAEAAHYLERLASPSSIFVRRQPFEATFARVAPWASARFGRAPPRPAFL